MLQKSNYSATMRIDWELYGRVLEARANLTEDELTAMREHQKFITSHFTKKGEPKPALFTTWKLIATNI